MIFRFTCYSYVCKEPSKQALDPDIKYSKKENMLSDIKMNHKDLFLMRPPDIQNSVSLNTSPEFITFVDTNLKQKHVQSCEEKHKNYQQTQPAFTCSKLTIETLEQGVKYVQS